MGFPWRKIVSGVKHGAELGSLLGIPGAEALVRGVHVAESIPDLKGPQKREAAKAIAAQLVGDDGLLSDDPEVAAVVNQFVDAYVALLNLVAAKKAAA